ncbi:hypothetical protein MmiAt1_12420 [Methanimicrococcus sp. At1]|uniref:Uncharacterized protein n=1 Tax=Methanimicrococcus hacksteinii TaxID=3028293 RepID=A0ABU3VQF9_9EURY|nr:hypothetical protein [Methanimicrococcus sp. At1]MDV0445650.1 hypothetical protein [Methanimicrococcus sp. At1]
MKAQHFLIFFTIIAGILIAAATVHYTAPIQTEIQFRQMEIHFVNENATAKVEYEVGFLTQLYVFFFGSRNLDPYLDQLLYDFDEYQITSVHGTTATIELINASRPSGSYYLHDQHMLGYEVGRLIIYDPDGKTLSFENATRTPNTFYDI